MDYIIRDANDAIYYGKSTIRFRWFNEGYDVSFYGLNWWLGKGYFPVDYTDGFKISYAREMVKATRLEF